MSMGQKNIFLWWYLMWVDNIKRQVSITFDISFQKRKKTFDINNEQNVKVVAFGVQNVTVAALVEQML
jgi:hypothetical protein